MGPSPYRRLDSVIDEATLREARIDTDTRTARLRLGVLLHTTGPDDPQPERTLVLSDLSRAAVCLRRLRQERRARRETAAATGEPRRSGRHAKPAPPVIAHVVPPGTPPGGASGAPGGASGAAGGASGAAGGASGAAAKVPGPPILLRDAAGIASWLGRWSGTDLYDQPTEIFDAVTAPEWLLQPSIDLTWPTTAPAHSMDLRLADRRGPGGHLYRLEVRLEFGALEVLDADGATDDPDALADAVAAWWQDMHAGLTNGRYGLYPADSPVAV